MSNMLVSDVDLDLLRVGDFVKHHTYGIGIIESIEDQKITVRFTSGSFGGSLYANHDQWNDTIWIALGLEFNEDADSLTIRRNDANEFQSL